MMTLLKWAENQQHRVIASHELPALKQSLMIDSDPVLLSQRLWSWIQLCIPETDNAMTMFNNGEALNGLEFWRKLVVPHVGRTAARRLRLRDVVQGPKGATTFTGTEAALVVWDKDLLDYIAAGATMPGDEDLVHAMLKMLPPLSQEMLAKAHAESTPEQLREWIRLQAEFERENPARRAAAHMVVAAEAEAVTSPGADADEEVLELAPETLACMTAQEVNAFYKARGFKQVGPKRGNQRTSSGARAEGERRPPKCANCNRDGHVAADCRQKRVDAKDRRCHNSVSYTHLTLPTNREV